MRAYVMTDVPTPQSDVQDQSVPGTENVRPRRSRGKFISLAFFQLAVLAWATASDLRPWKVAIFIVFEGLLIIQFLALVLHGRRMQARGPGHNRGG